MEDGSERPISVVSQSLTPAEKHYSQLDKEALAIIFRDKKFYLYMYGDPFTIRSDHKPLSYLFKETKPVSICVTAEMGSYTQYISIQH